MVARDIGRPMELARDPRVYHVRDSSIYAHSDEIHENKYFGYFMEARPQGVPYEVTISEHWSLLHGKKPSQPPPPTPSAELRSEIIAPYVDMSEREETSDESSVEQQWTFSPWSHEHLLTIKFYVHSLRDLVEHFAEEAGYDFSYLMQPYNWTRVTAVLAMPEPGSVKPCTDCLLLRQKKKEREREIYKCIYKTPADQLKSVTIYDRIHDSSLVWGEVEKDFRLFEVTSYVLFLLARFSFSPNVTPAYRYDSWRWNPTGVPIAAPSLDYAEVLTRYMPRWATRRPDAEALAQNSGWSVKMFHSWPPLSAQTLSTTTGADNKDKPLPAQYDDLYEAVDPGNSARMRENMAKVYNPSLTGRWAHEYVGLRDIK